MIDRYAALHARGIIHNGAKPGNVCLAPLSFNAFPILNLIDFGASYLYKENPLRRNEELSGNRRFWSALIHQGFTQSQRDDLESLGYLLSALYQGSLPWDSRLQAYNAWRIKMSTPGSTLFRKMDPSFLEYWKEVRTLAFAEVPDYAALKSHFVQCWERKGFDNLPGEYDWLALVNGFLGPAKEKKFPAPLDNPLDNSAGATSVVPPAI